MRFLPFLLAIAAFARTPLIDAARNSDKDAVRSLIQKRADVNAAEGDGATALHWAAYRDDLENAQALLRAGAKVNAANDLGVTALWNACENGSSKMVKLLLDAGANPNAALASGETPLMVAARGGYADVVAQLIARDANVNAHGTRDQTALMWAVSQKHPGVVKVLIANHASIQAKSATWSEVMAVPPHGHLPYNKAIPHGGETALMFAARVGDLDSAQLLVAAGANVNDRDAWGVSAVTLAAHSDFEDLVDFLLDKDADPNAAPAGFTALHEAVMRRSIHMVTALLNHGADVNAPLKTWTPTRRSSDDANFPPALVGATPFWLAARFTDPAMMRLLASRGADPKIVHTVSYLAEEGGFGGHERNESLNALMAVSGLAGRAQSWVEIPRNQKEPLALESAKVAVELGIDVNAVNSDDRTALDGARTLKYESLVRFLTEHGAKAGR